MTVKLSKPRSTTRKKPLAVMAKLGVTLALTFSTCVFAQQAVDIPAQSLASALNALGQQTSLQVIYNAELIAGRQSHAVHGMLENEEVLGQLLKGTGITFDVSGNSVTLVVPSTHGLMMMSPVKVESSAITESANGPVDGYIATRTSAGTKTDAAITEVARSISVVSREQIEAQGAANINEVLRYTAGVFSEANGVNDRYVEISARGFSGVKTYLDGMDSNLGGGFIPPDTYGLERVTSLRGPSSTLYGSGSVGGVVDMTTKRPTEEPLREIEIVRGTYRHNEGRMDISDRVADNDDLRYRLTATWRDTGTQINKVDDNGIFIAPVISWSLNDKTDLTLLGYHTHEKGGNLNIKLPITGSLKPHPLGKLSNDTFFGNPDSDYYDATTSSIAWEIDHKFTDSWSIKHQARYSESEYEQNFLELQGLLNESFIGGLVPEYRMNINDPSPAMLAYLPPMFGGPAQFNVPNPYAGYIPGRTAISYNGGYYNKGDSTTSDTLIFGEVMTGSAVKHNLLFGIDYLKETTEFSRLNPGDITAFGSNGLTGVLEQLTPVDIFDPQYETFGGAPVKGDYRPSTVTQLGTYFQDRMTINEKLIISFGARHDKYDSDGITYDSNRENPRVSTDLHEKNTSYQGGINYLFDSGYAPYVSYSESFVPQSGENYLKKAFEPTTGTQYEAGVKYESPDKKMFVTLAYFDLSRNNLPITDDKHFGCDEGNPLSTCQKAAGEVTSSGVELEVKATPFPELNIMASYSTNDVHVAVDDDPDLIGKSLTSQPEKQAAVWAMYHFYSGPLEGLGISAGTRYVGSSYADTANTLEVPSYMLVDMGLYYNARNGLSFALNASNITDKQYLASCNTSTCSQGLSRKVTGTLSYRW